MSTPDQIDVQALLEPIPGDNPAGSSVSYMLTQQLEEARREVRPEDAHDETEVKRADWPTIVRLTQQALKTESKDLLLAARFTEALVRQYGPQGYGFEALHVGLRLLRGLVEQCWDRIQPILEEPDDLERRAAAFNWLNNPDRGIRFPNTLRLLPLLVGKSGSISYQDWKESPNPPSDGPTAADIEKILAEANPTQIQRVADAASHALEELAAIISTLDERMESVAPNLLDLRTALEGCAELARSFAARRSSETVEEQPSEAASEPEAEGTTPAGGRPATPSSRAEVYAQLRRAASVLRALEPHSPVPYLIDRAIELGDLPFHLMIRQLIRDANVLAELNRELGIKGDSAPVEPAES